VSAATLIRQASAAGIELRLVDGKVKASGHADAVALMVDQLRANKADLIRWFTESAANDLKPPNEPGAWRELAAAYNTHHFQCQTCIAAGLGYGLRCGAGAPMWTAYQTVI
jgi:hypothetical protein